MVDRSFYFILLHFKDEAVAFNSIRESKSAYFLFLISLSFFRKLYKDKAVWHDVPCDREYRFFCQLEDSGKLWSRTA